MNNKRIAEAIILGAFLCLGLIVLGYLISSSVIGIKALDRTVTVKGLSEREVPANRAIWPIKFSEADNDLSHLYSVIQQKTELVVAFLKKNGFEDNEISILAPAILDRQAQGYVDPNKVKFRYTASSTITVYTTKVDSIRETMKKLVELGKQGIAIGGQDYQTRTEYLFTELNRIKPEMIEAATKKAREVAEKFAKDSNSRLGKIKRARQGQFSITNRDSNTPYIKKVRIVSTLEYYLSD
jgi:hypothetical protein